MCGRGQGAVLFSTSQSTIWNLYAAQKLTDEGSFRGEKKFMSILKGLL